MEAATQLPSWAIFYSDWLRLPLVRVPISPRTPIGRIVETPKVFA